MLATALENNGAVVYIVGRRLSILEQAAAERNVRRTHPLAPRGQALMILSTVTVATFSIHIASLVYCIGRHSGIGT